MINMGKLHYGNCNQMVSDLNKELSWYKKENEHLKGSIRILDGTRNDCEMTLINNKAQVEDLKTQLKELKFDRDSCRNTVQQQRDIANQLRDELNHLRQDIENNAALAHKESTPISVEVLKFEGPVKHHKNKR